jgi:Zn-dependent M28 family amino/carboxypeptidase
MKFQLPEAAPFRATIPEIIARVNAADLRAFDEYLSGERSTIHSRNSIAPGARTAADYIAGEFRRYGFNVEQHNFQTNYGPNVIGTMRGTRFPNRIVVLGAHYDSRGAQQSSATARAPGANDDGSGTAALLQIAKIIGTFPLRPRYTIQLQAYCGEEQGLLGSRALARRMKQNGDDILGMLQADMIAYRRPGENTQCAFPNRNDNKALTARAQNIVRQYVPEITVGITTACCSDHQSFTNEGYPATQVFERNGAIADPQYHREGDLVNRVGFDFEQYTQLTRAYLAIACDLAEFD